MQVDVTRFKEAFIEESLENLVAMEAGLLSLESAPADADLLNSIFRAAHSIKGGSGTFGLDALGHFTHSVENLLDRLRRQELPATKARVELLLRSRDMMQALFDAARGLGEAPQVAELLRELAAELGESAPAAAHASAAAGASPAVARRWKVHFTPAEDVFLSGQDLLFVLRDLEATGTFVGCELDLSALPALEELDPERCHLAWDLELESSADEAALREVFAFVETGAELTFTPVAAARAEGAPASGRVERRRAGNEGSSIRVPVEKVDGLIDLVGELVIAQSMVTALVQDFTPARLGALRDAVGQMRRNTRELQGRVMSVRMVPVASVFGRFPRLVHDLAAQLEKPMELVLEGEDTELDKGVIEQLADPLTHMVRNCADHGIESAELRRAAGKPAHGTIRLSAAARNGSVMIEVQDDGRGLDPARIRAKAEEKGLVAPAQELSRNEIQELIFLPGFSTAQAVTDLSGRGVGMDVVKSAVEGLNGSIQIESEVGRGTTLRLKLPLTLAILDGLLLRVGGQVFVLALTSILETLRPARADLETVLGRGELVMVRGKPVPLLRLHGMLEVSDECVDPAAAMVILVEHDGKRLALLADELLGQQEVVLKNLDSDCLRVDGVLGATILGDGRVAMILDVPGLVRLAARAPVAKHGGAA